jgi:hypothetical protein
MTAEATYEEIVDDVLARNAECERSQMMGMPCVKRNGKMVAGFSRGSDEMVFKLTDDEQREAALALGGAHLFDPSGKGRPFKEWVAVPSEHAGEWPQLAERALSV